MADLIDRGKLIDYIMESDPDWCVKPVRPIFDFINAFPSADAVEVVRCKNCRHYGAYHKADDHTKVSIEKYGLRCVIMQRIMFPYHYCCFGVKNE